MSNLKELINEYLEIDEKLDAVGHEIDHLVYDTEFLVAVTKFEGEEQIVTIIVGEDDEYFIPVYTDEEEYNTAIELFKTEAEGVEFSFDKHTGANIVQTYSDDEDFIGLAINAPQCDFQIAADHVHTC